MKNIEFKLTLLLLLASRFSNAATITGQVYSSKTNEQYANLLLYNSKDSIFVKGEVTDAEGSFVFVNIKEGTYYLKIRKVGFEETLKSGIAITEYKESVNLGKIELKALEKQLNQVIIQADKPFIEQQVDKMVVNIDNSILQKGSSLIEMLDKMPGVNVDQNGRISLRGKQGVIVMIDGKKTQLSGQDLINNLQAIPSTGVQKVEIITNPSAKYDADGNSGIINIITKKNRREGFNGTASLSYGQGLYPKYSGNINLSYKFKKTNLYINYSISRRIGFNHLSIDRKFYRQDTVNTTYKTENYITWPSFNQTPRLGADFYLSKKTTLSLIGNGSYTHYDTHTTDHTDILAGRKILVRDYDFENQSKDNWYNMAISSEITHQLDTSGQEIKFDMDLGKYWNNNNQKFTTSYHDPNGNLLSNEFLNSDQLGSLSLWVAKVDYTLPLKKSAKFETGVKSSYVSSDNNVRFFNNSNNENIFDSLRSSHFIYSENINAGYINYSKEFTKWSIQGGLRGEQTNAKGLQILNSKSFTRNYFQLFPTFFISYSPSKEHNFKLSAGRRIDRPAYDQMNPYKSLIDATTFSEGNPYLRPQLTYNSELSWTFKSMFFVIAGYSHTFDNITEVLIQDSTTRTTTQTIVNLDELNYYNLNLIFSKKLTKWWTTNTSLLSYFGIYTGNINSNHINQGAPTFNFSTSNSFPIKPGLSAEVSYKYNHRNIYGVTTMLTTSNLSAGVQKSVLKNRGTFTVNISDIFWHAFPSGITEFDQVREDWVARRDTRVINFAFTYKIGSGKPIRMRRNTGADEEKSRIQTS